MHVDHIVREAVYNLRRYEFSERGDDTDVEAIAIDEFVDILPFVYWHFILYTPSSYLPLLELEQKDLRHSWYQEQ